MNNIRLPNFITFQNINEAHNLISKKELELNELRSALSFKKLMNIFELNSELKSLTLKGEYIFGGHVLYAVSATYFNGRVVKENKSMFDLLNEILGYDNLKKILAMDGFVIGRDSDSSNKLKSIFNIKNLSDKCIDKITTNNISLIEDAVGGDFNKIKNLKQQVLVVSILQLFKKYPNLKGMSLRIGDVPMGKYVSVDSILYNDKGLDNKGDSKVIIEEVKGMNKKDDAMRLFIMPRVPVTIYKNDLDSIRGLIKGLEYFDVSLDNFSKVLEREILEENISKNIIENKDSKMKI